MSGTQIWLVTVALAFFVTVRQTNDLFAGESAWGAVAMGVCLCWFGPLTILAMLALKPCEAEYARRKAELAELEAREAQALAARERALGLRR